MHYRDLGRTGITASALAFGCMRFPKLGDKNSVDREASVGLMNRAYELGVNYYDTAFVYDGGESERAVGELIKEVPRDKVFVADKNPVGSHWYRVPSDRTPKDFWWEHLEEMLRRLDTDYIDVCHHHDISSSSFRMLIEPPHGLLGQALKAKEQGLIRHIGISSHDSPGNIIQVLEAASGAIEVIVIQYNLLDRRNEPVIQYAQENGIGVAIMGPVGGGRLIHPSEQYRKAVAVRSTPELALRFVLAREGVSCAMSGMNTLEQLEENVRAASQEEPLMQEELERLDDVRIENEELLDLYCTGCGYCIPCPHHVDIPGNFSALNMLRVHGLSETAQQMYDRLAKGQAVYCEECGRCLGKCPQRIQIPERLREVAEVFSTCSSRDTAAD